MFSMFGRIGAPTKMGPHMRTKKSLVLSVETFRLINASRMRFLLVSTFVRRQLNITVVLMRKLLHSFCALNNSKMRLRSGLHPEPSSRSFYSALPDPGEGARCFSPRVEICRLSMKWQLCVWVWSRDGNGSSFVTHEPCNPSHSWPGWPTWPMIHDPWPLHHFILVHASYDNLD